VSPRKVPSVGLVALGVLLGSALTLLVVEANRPASREPAPASKTLVTMLGPVRLTRGRLYGQTDYAPYPAPLKKPPSEMEGFLRGRVGASPPSPAQLRDRAVHQMSSKRGDTAEAIAMLESAVRLAPGDAALLSDLATLHSERAHRNNRPQDYLAAFESAARAVALAPDLPEAVFNHALALEDLFLFEAASEGWMRYLDLDTSSPWSAEARVRLERLSRSANVPSDGRDLILQTIEAQSLLADSFESVGRPEEAWKYRYQALGLSSRLPTGPQLYTALDVLDGAVIDSLAQRRPEAALAFQSHAISISEALQKPAEVVLALLSRARIEAALGRQNEARRDFEQALTRLQHPQISDRELLAARIEIVRNEIADSESRLTALASESLVPGMLAAQADLHFRSGDTASAESALRQALDELERQRERIVPGSYRVSFLDQAQPLYDRMVALQLHLGKPEQALEVLERFRARALLDQIRDLSSRDGNTELAAPLKSPDLCQRLPERTFIVIYAVVEGRLVTWVVQSSEIRVPPHRPEWSTLSSLAQALQDRNRNETERRKLLEQLHEELIAPWKRELRRGDRIIFVPTHSLYSVPFAALIDPRSGRYLVQDHALGVAPSASEFVAAMERDYRISAKPLATALLVGDADWSRSLWPQFPSLPAAEWEINTLRQLYRGLDTRVLTREEATSGRVLESLRGSDIVHFTAHSLADHEDPSRSYLMLSPSGSDPGELSARDLLGVHLTRTRLVVLAACGSNSGLISQSEGSLSLAYSFLASGAPAVVGSLWQVEDKSTARLSILLHQELVRGADALTALRNAQLQEIAANRGLSNWTWASFQVFGGVTARGE
jgi:CHAT domain-containing protein